MTKLKWNDPVFFIFFTPFLALEFPKDFERIELQIPYVHSMCGGWAWAQTRDL